MLSFRQNTVSGFRFSPGRPLLASCIFLLGLLFCAGFSSGQTPEPAAQDSNKKSEQMLEEQIRGNPLKVIYTGALFGYYRIESNGKEMLAPVRNWFELRVGKSEDPKSGGSTLLLGMGDNFGPEMGGSIQMENKAGEKDAASVECEMPLTPVPDTLGARQHEKLYKTLTQGNVPIPIALYKDGVRAAKKAECDNVTRFLIQAGYNAVVPGREDFLYSSTWLARMARDLQAHAALKDSTGPLMLSANLQLKFREAKPPEDGSFKLRPEDYEKLSPLLFTKCAGKNEDANAAENTQKPEDRNPGCPVNLTGREVRKPGQVTPTSTIIDEQKDVGYTILPLKDSSGDSMNVLVVGVIAKDTMGAISPSNRKLCFLVYQANKSNQRADDNQKIANNNKEWRSVACDVNERQPNEGLAVFDVEAADPVGPLIDILRATGGNPGNIAYRILMAQMPRSSAEELAAKLRTRMQTDSNNTPNTHKTLYQFDLVISEAQVRQSSPEVELNYYKFNNVWDLDPTVTPYPAYRQGRCPVNDNSDECKENNGYFSAGLFRPDSTVTLITTWEEGAAKVEKRTLKNKPPESRNMAVFSAPSSKDSGNGNIATDTPETAATHQGQDVSPKGNGDTTMHLLMVALDDVNKKNYAYSFPESPKQKTEDKGSHSVACAEDKKLGSQQCFVASAEHCTMEQTKGNKERLRACNAAITKYLLQTMQQFGHADAALLEMRDIFTGFLPAGYDGYKSVCNMEAGDEWGQKICNLRVALDRVLWKGDYAEKVMIGGKDIQTLLMTSKKLRDAEQTLNPRDTFDEWLVSFGITAKPEKSSAAPVRNSTGTGQPAVAITKLAMDAVDTTTAFKKEPAPDTGQDFLAIPITECRIFSPSDFANPSSRSSYCVDGEAIRSDHAYFILTSDHLASDTEVYGTMAGLPENYKEGHQGYLTKNIADFLVHGIGASSRASDPVKGLTTDKAEQNQQERNGIMQIDVAKAVVGYSARLPQGGDTNVQDKFQGASDTRASSPQSYEIDMEAKIRILRRIWHSDGLSFAIGSQSDFNYDRSVQGNLSDNPVNASYPLNSFTAGAFLQFGLEPKNGSPGKDPGILAGKRMIVVAPFQFQRQIVGSFLFFPFTPPSRAELTLRSPHLHGFSHRLGYRGEATQWKHWDPGTYAELGWQVAIQNNLLASATFSTPGFPSLPCPANSIVTINNCVKTAHLVINENTVATELLATLHSQGLYWDIHWQKGIAPLTDKSAGITLMVDTTGDWFIPRDGTKSLSSQTQYDIPVKLTLAFPILRNFSIGPAYSPFFYSNQVSHKSLVVQNFALNARWYFDRDAAVRLRRQLVFKGPASADETKTARAK
jgi:hypothetical protein